MKNVLIHFLFLSIIVAAVGCQSGPAEAGEGEEASSAAEQEDASAKRATPGTLLLQNDFVQVKKVVLQPGEKQDLHDGPARTIYSLTDYQIRWQENGRDEGTKTWRKGDVHWHEAGIHAAENIGNTPAEFLVVARTDTELPDCGDNTLDQDVQSVAPEKTEVLFDNAYVKVTRVDLQAGESIPRHAGINRVVLSLKDYEVAFTAEDQAEETNRFSAGDVHWHEACAHALRNVGEEDAAFVVFAVRQ